MRARWSLVILGCGVASVCAHLVAAGAFSGLRPLSADQAVAPDSPYLGGGAFTDFADLTEAMAVEDTAEADPVEATEAVEETETAETVPEDIPDPADPAGIVPDSPEMAADTVTDEMAAIPAPAADVRPRARARPEEPKPARKPATRQKPAEKKKAAPKPAEPARKAARPAQKTGTARGSTSQGDAPRAGSSTAAKSYPAQVQRKIARTRQRRSGAPGRVVVAFSVNGSGGLTGLSIAQSSGKSSTDQAALDHIRRAAPFPAPPAGARRSFRIPVSVK